MTEERKKAELLIKTAKGQLDGVLRMLEEDRYCIEVSAQLLAARAVLDKANRHILRGHMESCMRAAFRSEDEGEQQEKLDELMRLMAKM